MSWGKRRKATAVVVVGLSLVGASAQAETATFTPAVWDASAKVWVTTAKAAASNLIQRFPNANLVQCVPPDSGGNSQVIGSVRYWDAFKCIGFPRRGPPKIFSLHYIVQGGCGKCWTINSLDGASVALLKRKPPTAAVPWYWSEGLANDRVSHSTWIEGKYLDPNTVDCGGFGNSISENGTLEYQHFCCRIYFGNSGSIYFIYRLTVTGRDTFTMVRLSTGVG